MSREVLSKAGTVSRDSGPSDLDSTITKWAHEADHDSIPEAARERVKRSLLDVLGCGIFGTGLETPFAPVNFVHSRMPGSEATIFGGGGKSTAFGAALANGAYVHRTEFSEGFTRGAVHPGNSVIPGMLALGERDKLTGADFLAGGVIAYELIIRLGVAMGVPLAMAQSMHSPTVLGTFGAAAGCARLRRLDLKKFGNALGIASGLVPSAPMTDTGVKDVYQGYNSGLGILSTDMAESGVDGPQRWLSQWLGAVPRHVDREVLDSDLGQYWHLTSGGLRVKTRPVMAMAQPTTWAMYDLLSAHEFPVEDVKTVRVESSKRIRLGDIRPPRSTVAARMSIPFLVAAALVHRKDYLADPYLTKFITPELLNDSRIAELSDRVELVANDEFDFNLEHATPSTDSNHYMKFEARVTVTLKDGSQMVQYKDVFAEGTGAMSRERLENKFRALTDGKISEKQAAKIIAAVWSLEDLRDVGDLARMTSEGTERQANAR